MNTYKDLLAQHAQLLAQIAAAKSEVRAEALAQARVLIADFNLSSKELFPKATKRRSVVRYKHPQTGATWSGRGRPPAWIEGQDRTLFEIAPPSMWA
jgi:DNA-binding protein H-NS